MQPSVITVFDRKTSSFQNPMTYKHVGDAIRDFDTVKKDDKTKIGQHPEDFELYKIGEFNEDNGEITPIKPLQLA